MIINYSKHWGPDGTVYTQTIKIDGWIADRFNKLLKEKKENIKQDFLKKRLYSDYDLKIKKLNYLEKNLNFTNLIHLDVFLELINILNSEGYNFSFKKILFRNTIIQVLN